MTSLIHSDTVLFDLNLIIVTPSIDHIIVILITALLTAQFSTRKQNYGVFYIKGKYQEEM